jgi:hypothetical protein
MRNRRQLKDAFQLENRRRRTIPAAAPEYDPVPAG